MSKVDKMYYQQALAYNEIEAYQAKRDELDGKIERLKTARDGIAAHKDTVFDQRGAESSMMFVENWQGKNYTEYQEKVRDGLTNSFNNYYNEVDNAQDELNIEIANLQNECFEVLGCIGNVQNFINDIITAIRNTFN